MAGSMVGPPKGDKDTPRAGAVLAAVFASRVAVLWLLVGPLWGSGPVSHLVQDLRTWKEFFEATAAGAVPYVHLTREYPVLGGIVYWLLSPFVDPGDLRQTVFVHGTFMAGVDLVNAALFLQLARRVVPARAPLAALMFALNLTALVLGPVRYESVVVTFVLLGYAAHLRGRFLNAAVWWALGCGLKWYPAFFLAAQEYRLWRSGRRWHWAAALGTFVATFVGLHLPFAIGSLAIGGTLDPLLAPYLFHAQRPLYWDTVLGVAQIWLGPLPWERYAGLWTLGLMAAAGLVRPAMGVERKGVLICLAAVVFNRIYSAQFNLWFYPFLILEALKAAGRERRVLLGAFVALDLLNAAIFPPTFTGAVAEMGGFFPYAAREGGGPWTVAFSAAIVARALVIVGLAAWLLRSPTPAGDAAPLDTSRPGPA
jgi:hypothetical protein